MPIIAHISLKQKMCPTGRGWPEGSRLTASPWVRPYDRAAPGLTTPMLANPPRKRFHDPQPFPGLTRKPHCGACRVI